KRKYDPVTFRAASSGICLSRVIVREVGTDHGIFFHPVGKLEDAVAAQVNHAGFVSTHNHWRIPMETTARLTFRWLRTQTAYFPVAQIDPMYFAALTFRIKRVAIGRIEQDVEAVATGKRGPIAVTKALFTLYSARSDPVFVILKTARNSEIRFRVVE